MGKGEIGIDVGSKRDVSVMSTWKRNEDTGKMEIISLEPQIIELEAEEVGDELPHITELLDHQIKTLEKLYGINAKDETDAQFAQAKFNQLNKRKPKQDFSWDELEQLTNQNEIDL